MTYKSQITPATLDLAAHVGAKLATNLTPARRVLFNRIACYFTQPQRVRMNDAYMATTKAPFGWAMVEGDAK